MMMKLKMAAVLFSSALAGCASYTLPVPPEFSAATTLPVTGASGFNQQSMTVGDYQVTIDRGSTQGRAGEGSGISTSRKQQNYSFVIRRAGATAFSGGCTLSAKATNIGAPGGVQITAKENAELDCAMLPQGTGSASWRLQLSGDPDNPLHGQLSGAHHYTLQGIGTAIGSTRHGPTGGYYIKQEERTVASVQTTGKRQVLFAPGAHSDALVAAAVVLLLIDESVRDLD
ncbi:MAG TPA: hypothetical protein VGC44_06550 [Longimicrobiales bacterium]